MQTLQYKFMDSIVGTLKIVANDQYLLAVLWDNEKPNRVKLDAMHEDSSNSLLLEVEKQLKEYFKGKRQIFDLPMEMHGTPFQKNVWNELKKIPYGQTLSYKEIAQNLNNKKAVRAVGSANGRNPISIIVPCHRVIGADGKLSGFAGGVDKKERLLKLENSF